MKNPINKLILIEVLLAVLVWGVFFLGIYLFWRGTLLALLLSLVACFIGNLLIVDVQRLRRYNKFKQKTKKQL